MVQWAAVALGLDRNGGAFGSPGDGADLAYIGSPFIATEEASREGYKQGIVEGQASDIVYTNLFTGVHGNYLRKSIVNSGFDPDNLPESDPPRWSSAPAGRTRARLGGTFGAVVRGSVPSRPCPRRRRWWTGSPVSTNGPIQL